MREKLPEGGVNERLPPGVSELRWFKYIAFASLESQYKGRALAANTESGPRMSYSLIALVLLCGERKEKERKE